MKLGPESETTPGVGSAGATDRPCEIASVLFTDIVSYSTLTIDRQSELLTALQQIVKDSPEFQQARSRDAVITLPTGDGMALVFFGDPVAAVRCALQVAQSLRARPEIRLRMGIHSGPVWRHADIKDELNVVGGGINMAQRVMDCGDAGHILLSGNVADVLLQLSGWSDAVHDLGEFQVKHGARVRIYNLYRDDAGNPAPPRKQPVAPVAQPAPSRRGIVVAVLVMAGVLAAGGVYFLRRPAASQAPPHPPERTLSYYLMVQKFRAGRPYQGEFRWSGLHVFEAGYHARFFFSSPESGYLYILNEGPDSKPGAPVFNALFPSPLNNGGSALLAPGSELQIPQGGPLIFDEEKGVEKLWLIWSKNNQLQLDAIRQWLNPKDKGAIGDRTQLLAIQSFLSDHAQPQPEMAEDEAHQCTVVRGRSDILVSLLKLQHD
jgi:class 3 adenylate cyclase